MQVGWCKVGEFLPVNHLRLRRATAADVYSSARTTVLLLSTTSARRAYDDNVCNANDVGLKARSHRDDINEVSRQFIAVLVCQFNSL